jgi:hypothetical protein
VVCFNIPGKADYNPSLPWLYKLHCSDNCIANDIFVCVDDVRSTGGTYDTCWAVTRAVASQYNYLGLQDAPQKRQAPSRQAGPWTGSTVYTHNDTVTVTVTLECWNKAQGMIQWLYDCIVVNTVPLGHKQLESYQGSLVHLSCTYPSMVPYLKGILLTLDSLHPGPDADG